VGSNYKSWRISTINDRFAVCQSYPRVIAVPSTIKDSILQVAATTSRSRNRFPALTWLHPNGAALCRCSQPLNGMLDAPNAEDDSLLLAIRASVSASRVSLIIEQGQQFVSYSAVASTTPPNEGDHMKKARAYTMDEDSCFVSIDDRQLRLSSESTPSTSENIPIQVTASRQVEPTVRGASTVNNIKLRICDARPLLNASMNKLAGELSVCPDTARDQSAVVVYMYCR
jgi:hypothetical protein